VNSLAILDGIEQLLQSLGGVRALDGFSYIPSMTISQQYYWETPAVGGDSASGVCSILEVPADNAVYLGLSYNLYGYVKKYNLETNELIWERGLGGPVRNVMLYNGKLYAMGDHWEGGGADTSKVRQLNRDTGLVEWTGATQITNDNDRLNYREFSSDGYVYSTGGFSTGIAEKRSIDGAYVWRVGGGGSTTAEKGYCIALDETRGELIVGGHGNSFALSKLRMSDGGQIWRNYVDVGVSNSVKAVAVDPDGNVYWGAANRLYKSNSSGTLVWTGNKYINLTGEITDIVWHGGFLYVGTAQNAYKVDPSGSIGQVVWTLASGMSMSLTCHAGTRGLYIGGYASSANQKAKRIDMVSGTYAEKLHLREYQIHHYSRRDLL